MEHGGSLSPTSQKLRLSARNSFCSHTNPFLFLMESPRWWTKDTVAVVTGGNKGIGFEIVKQLANEGLTVVLTARDEQRGQDAAKALKADGLDVAFHPLDVQSTDSISQLAAWLKEQYDGIDIVVNNSAIATHDVEYETAKSVLDTNYEGVKRVTRKLLPLLRPSPAGARVVNVSSSLGQLERLNDAFWRGEFSEVDNLSEERVDEFVQRFLDGIKAGVTDATEWVGKMYPIYSISKVALNAYTRALAKALKDRPDGQKVYVNCMHPGFVKTDLIRNTGILSPAEGADTAVWLALLPPGGPTGQFFYQRRIFSF